MDCHGLTFEGTAASCSKVPCKMYIKRASASNSDTGWTTLTKHKRPPSGQGKTECYSTLVFMKHAVATIAQHDTAAGPLFLYLAFQDVHEPVEVPALYASPFKATIADSTRQTYAGMVSVVDEALANLTTALVANNGMWHNTILVVSNDNGGWMGYGGINYPYRSHKTTLWEGGIRGIGFVVAPGRIQAGGRADSLVHVTDWLPTLYTAAGGDVAALGKTRGFEGLDGVDQWQHLTGAEAKGPRTEILHNIDGMHGTGEAAIRVGDFKLLRNPTGTDMWCDTCLKAAGCVDSRKNTIKHGGEVPVRQPCTHVGCHGGASAGLVVVVVVVVVSGWCLAGVGVASAWRRRGVAGQAFCRQPRCGRKKTQRR